MDYRLFCYGLLLRACRHTPLHKQENLQRTAAGLDELEAQARCPAAMLRPGAWLAACAPADVRVPLRCRDRPQSAANVSRPAALADTPSDPTFPSRAIANRRETRPEDVPAAQKN